MLPEFMGPPPMGASPPQMSREGALSPDIPGGPWVGLFLKGCLENPELKN